MPPKKPQSTTAPKQLSPFDTISKISETRPISFKQLEETGHYYDTFLVNRAFSQSEDTVLVAALMNERSHLDKDIQAAFLISTIRPKKRWGKWPKVNKDEREQIVANYYGMSLREAKQSVHLHTPEQLTKMEKIIEAGKVSRFAPKN